MTARRRLDGRLYVEGMRNGDGAKLREAFHAQAWMFGTLGGTRYDEPIGELITMVDGHSVDVDGSYQARVVSIQQAGDAAFAVVEDGRLLGHGVLHGLLYAGADRRQMGDRQQDLRAHRW
jgi:hypothetical protein